MCHFEFEQNALRNLIYDLLRAWCECHEIKWPSYYQIRFTVRVKVKLNTNIADILPQLAPTHPCIF